MYKFICLLFTLLNVSSAFAFSVSPMESIIKINEEKTKTITVTNASKTPLSIETQIFTRSYSLTGEEINKPVEKKDFMIFPKTIIVPAGESRGVRVIYIGERDIKNEKSYRLRIVNVNSEEFETHHQKFGVNYSIEPSLFVQPKKESPDLKLNGWDRDGGNLVLHFENKGSTHQLVYKIKVLLKNKDRKVIKELDENVKSLTVNFLANEKRDVKVKVSPEVLNEIKDVKLDSFE